MPVARPDWPLVLELLDVALDLPQGDLPAWLAGLDLPHALRTNLEDMLRRDVPETADDFLLWLPALGHDGAAREGCLIGNWRLVRRVGEGGMSTVWLAVRADEQISKEVAIKLPHSGPGQESLVRRLVRERNILAGLEHANIARLYEVDVAEGGIPYLLMEYVRGSTLLAYAKAHSLTIEQRVDIFQQVLAAVQYAHGKLILHRDLKPANIHVADTGEVKLLDFGIAKLLSESASTTGATELTQSAGRPLTRAYASPEQLLDLPLGIASDVYSLGVVLCELLCGEHPHPLPHSSGARLEEAVLTLEPRPPSRRHPPDSVLASMDTTIQKWRRSVAGDLDAVILKSLARSPEDRYPSVTALSTDLGRWRAGHPVSARAPNSWYYARKFVLRHKLAVSSVSTAIAIMLVLASVAVVQGIEARRAAATAIAARHFMEQLFEGTDPDLFGGRAPTTSDLLAQGRDRLLADQRHEAALPANDLLSSVAQAQFALGDAPAADETITGLLKRLESADDPQLHIKALLQRVNFALNLTHLKEASKALAIAHALASKFGLDAPNRLDLAAFTGALARLDNRFDDAKLAYSEYLDLARQDAAASPSRTINVLLGMARVESRSGHPDDAYKLLEQADSLAKIHPELIGVQFREIAEYRTGIDIDYGRYAHLSNWLASTIPECNRALGAHAIACRVLDVQEVRALLKLGRGEQAVGFLEPLEYQAESDPAFVRQIEGAALAARTAVAAELRMKQDTMRAKLEKIDQQATPATVDQEYRLLVENTLIELAIAAGDFGRALTASAHARDLISAAGLAKSDEAVRTALFEGIAYAAQGQHSLALAHWGKQCDEFSLAARPMPLRERLFSLNCARSLALTGHRGQAIALVNAAMPVLRDGLGSDAPMLLRAQALLEQLLQQDDWVETRQSQFPVNYFT